MQIDVLGPLRVVGDDGSESTPRSAQQRRVLAALASAGEQGRAADVLEALLWPGGPPSANALQAVVSKLRKVVAPAEIVSEAGRYRLTGHTTDLDRFEALVAAGLGSEAEELLRGEPLVDLAAADDPAGPWEAERTRWTGLARRARVQRWQAAIGGADGSGPESVVHELESALVAAPVDEELWALLVTAHAEAGHDAAALRALSSARSVLADQLGIAPGPELRELERRILDGDSTPPRARPDAPPARADARRAVRGVPAALSSIVGRDEVLAELGVELGTRRLVTLVGPGGAGKTTTSLELARRAPIDAAIVELAPVTDRDGVIRRIGRALGLASGDPLAPAGVGDYDDPVERVVDALVEVGDVMLVVDNCEHVVADAADLVHRLLTACPGLRVLATSREPLGVPGERVVPLPPLPSADAVTLFLERAAEHGVAIETDLGHDEVADVCARLDGLPLAIELAAARLRTMTLAELSERLDDRFAVLSGGPRTADARQQTLRAVVDWSHDLLEPAERVVFRRLAPFVGGASATSAEVVCAGPSPDGIDIAPVDVLDLVERLVDKSLVLVERTPQGVRFGLLQTLHDYADEQLRRSGEREAVLVRHAQHLADALRPAIHELVHQDQVEWYQSIRRELPNIDAALDVAVGIGDAQLALELVTPIGWFYFMAGELERGANAMASALACDGEVEPSLRGLALGLYSWLLANGPDVERSLATTTEAMMLLEDSDDLFARGMVANTHLMSLFFSGRVEASKALVSMAVERSVASGDRWLLAVNRIVVAEIAQFEGRSVEAEEQFVLAAAEFEEMGDRFAYALAITEGAEIAEMVGDYDRAVEMLRRGIELVDEVGFSGHPIAMRARLGNVEILRGNLDAARREHERLLADRSSATVPWLHAMGHLGLASIARREGDLREAAAELERAWNSPRSRSVPYMRIQVQTGMGFLADQRGDAAAAIAHQTEAAAVALTLSSPRMTAYALEGAAGSLAVTGDRAAHELGARLLGAADATRRASGGPMPAAERFDVDRAEGRLRLALDDAVGPGFDACFGDGAGTSGDDLLRSFLRYAESV